MKTLIIKVRDEVYESTCEAVPEVRTELGEAVANGLLIEELDKAEVIGWVTNHKGEGVAFKNVSIDKVVKICKIMEN